MQALISYSPNQHDEVQAGLAWLADPPMGLSAVSCLTPKGWFGKLVWPDWPAALSQRLRGRVEGFITERCALVSFKEGSPEWESVFHGWRSDPSSAEVIATAFLRNFGDRVLWVEAERDYRGRIGANCRVRGLVQPTSFPPDHPLAKVVASKNPEDVEMINLQLSWKDSYIPHPGPMSEEDGVAFRSSVQEIFDWAAGRIRAVLDALHTKLEELYGDRFRGMYVFGSYARPDTGIELSADSDLDVALILSDFDNVYDEQQRFGDIVYDLSLKHSLAISVIPVREADFREGRTNFTRVISSYAVPDK